jgi:hypothetical protein
VRETHQLGLRPSRDAEGEVHEPRQGGEYRTARAGETQGDRELQPELMAICRMDGKTDEVTGVEGDRQRPQHRVNRMAADLGLGCTWLSFSLKSRTEELSSSLRGRTEESYADLRVASTPNSCISTRWWTLVKVAVSAPSAPPSRMESDGT